MGPRQRLGEDRRFPEGYALVHEVVRHVHFKNARVDPKTGGRGFDFDGVVDRAGQLVTLDADGYRGFVSIETHQRPKLAMTRRYLEMGALS